MTEREWDELKDRELDDSLAALFQFADQPEPLPGFTARTMKAVRRAPLPAGRRRLTKWKVTARHAEALRAKAGWLALVGGSAAATYGVVVSQPIVAELFAALVATGVRVGVWLMHLAGAAATLANLFTATGLAIARAVATRDGSIGLLLIASIGALSLAALRRLLISESEASVWQELS